MSEVSHWTNVDMANFVEKEKQMDLRCVYYCDVCSVVPVDVVGAYCDGCVRDIVEWLENENQNYIVEKGLN